MPEWLPAVLTVSVAVGVLLMIWFIVTLTIVARNTARTAEYVRTLAACQTPTDAQVRVINRALTTREIVERLQTRGVKLEVNLSGGLVISNTGMAEPEILALAREKDWDIVALLRSRPGA